MLITSLNTRKITITSMTEFPKNSIFLPPKNGEKRFDDQKVLSNKEERDCRKAVREAVYTSNIVNGEVKCCYCNAIVTVDSMTLEHKFPQCFGGSYIKSNLAPCCKKCNNDRSINFTHDGQIINIGHFKCPPLKTSIMQEKLCALIVVNLYSLYIGKNIEDVKLDEALNYFYKNIGDKERTVNLLPKSYRTYYMTHLVPCYKKLWWKITGLFKFLTFYK